MKHLTKNIHLLLTLIISLFATLPTPAQIPTGRNSLRALTDEYLLTDDAHRVGTQVLAYQRITGGWPKNIDMARPMSEEEMAQVLAEKNRTDDSTIDNNATTMQLTFLARLYGATRKAEYRDAFRRGVEYLLSGQYESGGWPQFWPDMKGYQVHITYNDDAMVNTLRLFRDMADDVAPYGGDLIERPLKRELEKAFDKGIECILRTQIIVDGQPTVWCQQHDRDTFLPTHARTYELPSYCSMESASLVRLLMELPRPDKRVKRAIHGAMRWFDTYKLTGLRYDHGGRISGGGRSILIEDTEAGPLWGRFYDFEQIKPYVCDRDGIPRRHLEQIGTERRNGYAWYTTRPADLYPLYDAWADRYDAKHKISISL